MNVSIHRPSPSVADAERGDEMTKRFLVVLAMATAAVLFFAEPLYSSQAPIARFQSRGDDGAGTGVGFVPYGGSAYEVFKRKSKGHDSAVRAAAEKELAADCDSKIDAALARACSDKKWPVRAAAVFAMARRDDRALLNVITPVLEDTHDIVRLRCIRRGAAVGRRKQVE